MKQILYSITLGLLVFIISYYWLDEPVKEARVLSSSDAAELRVEQTQTRGAPPPERDLLETEPINKDYEPAVVVEPDDQPGIIPERIEIPAIGVDAPVGKEGYTEEGGMAVPDSVTKVGWFEPGTKPGRKGNSVIAGHVDGRNGPAVFFDLKDLNAGDEIFVYGENGSKLTYTVQKVAAYPVSDAPLREIFGPTDQRALNLITCTGPYDREASGYTERLTVFTTLKDSRYAPS
ncbi:class F sortase [Halobacillus salinus]|uniref:Class F sortase n=1 Tax=Halobacillus salinus TaxID=192814 RepID=A0A4Z0H2E4_9BACI|nr:class F sortase [Halobacillus salinus]TGB04007.1 class F sortase [Halobacillus salinus]